MSEAGTGITCAACGAVNDAEAHFCQECGARLRPDRGPAAPDASAAPPSPLLVAPSEPVLAPDLAPPPVASVEGAATREPAPADSTAGSPPSFALPRVAGTASSSPRPTSRDADAVGGGNWLTTAPPRSVLIVGLILLLGACLLTTTGADVLREPLEPLLICAGPIGLLLVVVALVRLVIRRPPRHS